ncbi:MAG: hypothetical protein JWM33_2952 [Caulobacteraceae bacterium]|nr:hypothetical protein [Caulobacteraceae bacterium]
MTGSLFAILAAAALSAAAYPSDAPAPDRLPSQVVGVTGSGDDLSLQLRDGQATRSLKVGDVYQDGWTLQTLNPTEATLVKDGQARRVGLNPTGALASAAVAAPTVVQLVGMAIPPEAQEVLALTDAEVMERLTPSARTLFQTTVYPGLNAAETQTLNRLRARQSLLAKPLTDAALQRMRDAQAQGVAARVAVPDALEYAALLGQDYLTLTARQAEAWRQGELDQYAAVRSS